MPVKNTSDQFNLYWVFCIIGIAGLLFSFFTDRTTKTKPVVTGPPDSEKLAFVDKTCSELTKPELFNFVEKSSLISSFEISVNYKFKTSRSFEEIAPIFAIWLSSNGWRRVSRDQLIFRQDKYEITIENVNFPNYNF